MGYHQFLPLVKDLLRVGLREANILEEKTAVGRSEV